MLTQQQQNALAIMAAMAFEEGYFKVGNLAFRNNDPGDLRSWGTQPVENGFVKFPNKVSGFYALYRDILANSGKLTLRDFIAKFAPPTENNTSLYLQNVSIFSGIDPDSMF